MMPLNNGHSRKDDVRAGALNTIESKLDALQIRPAQHRHCILTAQETWRDRPIDAVDETGTEKRGAETRTTFAEETKNSALAQCAQPFRKLQRLSRAGTDLDNFGNRAQGLEALARPGWDEKDRALVSGFLYEYAAIGFDASRSRPRSRERMGARDHAGAAR